MCQNSPFYETTLATSICDEGDFSLWAFFPLNFSDFTSTG